MRNITICDRTLWEASARPDFPISFREKLEIAKQLAKLRVDVIETCPVEDAVADTVLLRTLSNLVGDCVLSCPAGASPEAADQAFSALKNAKKPRLNVRVPVSTVGMEYTFHKKPAAALEAIAALVRHAASLCADVEFSADDATRAEPTFLYDALRAAIKNGATTVTLCDTAGVMLPGEFAAFLENARKAVPELDTVRRGIRVSNALHMATACAFTAIAAGADEVGTAVGFSGDLSLKSVAQAIRARGDSLGIRCNLVQTELQRVAKQIQAITEPRHENTPYAGAIGRGESVSIERGADITRLGAVVRSLGYELSDEDLTKVHEAFARAAQKKEMGTKELEAIIAAVSLQVPPTYRLASYVMNSGNVITATASLTLERKGETLHGLSAGDGPIDAAFLAIEQILGHRYELDDFQIQAVTEGREAMGEALVKLRYAGRLYAGRGVSTDIIGASIQAYLNALNKIVFAAEGSDE